MATTLVRIQLLSKTSTDFATTNPVLLDGEFGVANAGSAIPVLKIGDGVRPWSALPDIVAAGAGADYVAGPVNTLPPGSPATVVIDNTVSPPTISFGIPAGVQGSHGDTGPVGPVGPIGPLGPANELTIGTVITGAPGSAAAATITGTPPTQVLNLAIPQGIQGPVGSIGPAGPANSLTIGTVTTGAPGSAADAAITGVPPNQTLSLTIPQGPQGIQGIQGIQGNPGTPGAGAPANPSAQVGLAAVNGVAVTFIRSDGAQALSQAIAPTWTAKHIYTYLGSSANATDAAIVIRSALPSLSFYEDDGPADAHGWNMIANGGAFLLRAPNDAGTAAPNVFVVNRAGAVLTDTAFNTKIIISPVPSTSEVLKLNATGPYIGFYDTAGTTRNGYLQMSPTSCAIVNEIAGNIISIYASNTLRAFFDTPGAGKAALKIIGTANSSYFMHGANQDTYIRTGQAAGIVYIGDAGSSAQVQFGSPVYHGTLYPHMPGIQNNVETHSLIWNNGGAFTYGSAYLTGSSTGAYHGLVINDNVLFPTLMSNGTASGLYLQGESKWLIYRSAANAASSSYPIDAPSFSVSSSRKIKRETGKPSRAAEMLSRLRPIMYRLLEKGSPEQLGMIAEEVAEVCPQLSNGKTISYDRLAVLLLADWQESRGIHFAT